ncbi:hypothetical protein B0H10DRAFT_2445215 [Mycena sp. CBHHK59/15]|nr:hypothetical protein B0H10DRAFT_2445215 [Mycena sp. CBHHK59/15]
MHYTVEVKIWTFKGVGLEVPGEVGENTRCLEKALGHGRGSGKESKRRAGAKSVARPIASHGVAVRNTPQPGSGRGTVERQEAGWQMGKPGTYSRQERRETDGAHSMDSETTTGEPARQVQDVLRLPVLLVVGHLDVHQTLLTVKTLNLSSLSSKFSLTIFLTIAIILLLGLSTTSTFSFSLPEKRSIQLHLEFLSVMISPVTSLRELNPSLTCKFGFSVWFIKIYGIGRAAALELARLGLKTAIPDLPACADALNCAELVEIVSEANVVVVPTDVTDLAAVQRLRDTVYEHRSEVGVLLNNAGISGAPRGTSWEGLASWHAVFATQLICRHAAYSNASKAATKSTTGTEGLAHELRERPTNVTAHESRSGFLSLVSASAPSALAARVPDVEAGGPPACAVGWGAAYGGGWIRMTRQSWAASPEPAASHHDHAPASGGTTAQQQHTHHAHIAAALELARLGLKTAVADLPACTDALNTLGAELVEIRLRDTVYQHWSEVGVLLNNAGISFAPRGTSWEGLASWHAVFATQLICRHAAYSNASKAATKSTTGTEGLAHELREGPTNVTAHESRSGFLSLVSAAYASVPSLHIPALCFTLTSCARHPTHALPSRLPCLPSPPRPVMYHSPSSSPYILCPSALSAASPMPIYALPPIFSHIHASSAAALLSVHRPPSRAPPSAPSFFPPSPSPSRARPSATSIRTPSTHPSRVAAPPIPSRVSTHHAPSLSVPPPPRPLFVRFPYIRPLPVHSSIPFLHHSLTSVHPSPPLRRVRGAYMCAVWTRRTWYARAAGWSAGDGVGRRKRRAMCMAADRLRRERLTRWSTPRCFSVHTARGRTAQRTGPLAEHEPTRGRAVMAGTQSTFPAADDLRVTAVGLRLRYECRAVDVVAALV